jgi:peptidoglycan hydrolase CwlO-like protein
VKQISQLKEKLGELKSMQVEKENKLEDLRESERKLKLEIMRVREDRQMRIGKAKEIEDRENERRLKAARKNIAI